MQKFVSVENDELPLYSSRCNIQNPKNNWAFNVFSWIFLVVKGWQYLGNHHVSCQL